MATEIDICNLALSHLGDEATVASIDPPEGSAQAEHCARYYPIARDAMLMHPWSFNTVRGALTELSAGPEFGWLYAFQRPSKALKILGIYAEGAGDLSDPLPYVTEILGDGTKVIYTNTDAIHCRYTIKVSDSGLFPPDVVVALSWLLASMLAGPIIKGRDGVAEANRCLNYYNTFALPMAKQSDAMQHIEPKNHTPSGIAAR